MDKKPQRPKSELELQDREVAGLWKAIALAKDIGESNEKITLSTILRIHKVIFKTASPEIAGRFRMDGEDVKKLKCVEPPPGRLVQQLVYAFWRELDAKLSVIPRRPQRWSKSQLKTWREKVIDIAAWTQHKLVAIHPFCDGNGRVARLMTSLILCRYGLLPTTVKYEGEDRNHYLDSLCQIDKTNNYAPLKTLILQGILHSYEKEQRIRSRTRR